MPKPYELYAYPFLNQSEALHNLAVVNVSHYKGIIRLVKSCEYQPQVLNAVDYLCDEWDYAVEWIDK